MGKLMDLPDADAAVGEQALTSECGSIGFFSFEFMKRTIFADEHVPGAVS